MSQPFHVVLKKIQDELPGRYVSILESCTSLEDAKNRVPTRYHYLIDELAAATHEGAPAPSESPIIAPETAPAASEPTSATQTDNEPTPSSGEEVGPVPHSRKSKKGKEE
jgi:hypothetical protein